MNIKWKNNINANFQQCTFYNFALCSLRCQHMMQRTNVEGIKIFSTISTNFSDKA